MNWNKFHTIVSIAGGIVLLIGSLVGAQQYFESKYAKAADLAEIQIVMELTQQRLEQKIIMDRIMSLEERKDKMELKPNPTQEDKERIKEYERDIKQLEVDLDNLHKKGDNG